MIFVVNGGKSVGFTVMRSPNSWNIVVPLGNRTEMCEFMRMSTLHFMLLERSVVDSARLKVNEIDWLEKNPRATETFGADSKNVSI